MMVGFNLHLLCALFCFPLSWDLYLLRSPAPCGLWLKRGGEEGPGLPTSSRGEGGESWNRCARDSGTWTSLRSWVEMKWDSSCRGGGEGRLVVGWWMELDTRGPPSTGKGLRDVVENTWIGTMSALPTFENKMELLLWAAKSANTVLVQNRIEDWTSLATGL